MAIVATEIESIHGTVGQQRMIFYRCQDDDGIWHSYGPIITSDDNFDADAHKTVVESKVGSQLAAREIEQALGT